MKERIRQIMNREAMSQQDFASTLGISPATLSSILNGRTNPSNNLVQAVHRAFPKININWLMFGEGTSDNSSVHSDVDSSEVIESPVEVVPLSSDHITSEDVSSSKYDHGYDNKGENLGDLFSSSTSKSTSTEPRNQVRNGSLRENVPHSQPRQEPSRHISEETIPQKRNSIDIPRREIREIRVFYSDGTYETFGPTSSESAYLRKK